MSLKKLRALIVEDSEPDCVLLLRELGKAGYEVEHRCVDSAPDMEDALDTATWDIILCDHVMPVFSGPDAIRLVKSKGMDVPLIIVSGQIGEEVAVGAMRLGAQDYILKGSLSRLGPAVERELTEAENRRQKKQAERDLLASRKMEELKDEFIGLISHEMRNPLTVVVGTLAMMQNPEGFGPEDLRQMVDEAYLEAKQLEGILDNLLELARAQADRLDLHRQAIKLPELVRGVIDDTAAEVDRVSMSAASDTPTVRGDPLRVQRILHNLIENAIKYSPDGGDVEVTLEKGDGEVVIGVHDHGIGIPARSVAGLFQPFHRLEGSRLTKGTGLGLIVCQRLTEAQGGRIWVESNEGEGSSFYFTLPEA